MRQNKHREWLQNMLAEQRQWMQERGESLAGYIEFYCGRYGRSKIEALAIYKADLAVLQRFEARMAR